MIYKTLKKVSEYCQLLDKSKYNPSQTINGVTFTNNSDGTFTANGTASKNIYFTILSDELELSTHKKYLLTGCPSGGTSYTYFLYVDRDGALFDLDTGNGSIGTPTKLRAVVTIFVRQGLTLNNLVFKPQLFDLTEMYGAGNEPTTVEEFREKFPNELYDYKPYCFVKSYKALLKATDDKIITSYKKSLICTTKNLFDIDKAVKVSGTATLTKNGNQIIVSQNGRGTYISGNILLDNSLVGKTITIRATAFTSSNNSARVRIQWCNENGNPAGSLLISSSYSGITPNDLIIKGVVPEKPDDTHNNLCLMFYSNSESALESGIIYSSTYYNVQLEEGSTATEYHPYGYL